MPVRVYAIPASGDPFLMFIADMGEERAHRNAHLTRLYYTKKLIGYEFRGQGDVRRFNFEVAA